MDNYCCDSFRESCEEGFIEIVKSAVHLEYTLQVYEFKNESNRSEFILNYCPFCGKKLEDK